MHRQRRHHDEAEAHINAAKGIGLQLLPEAAEDRLAAASMPMRHNQRLSEVRRGEKRLQLLSGSIFGGDASEGARAEEAKRLKLLQMRRERGMQITSAPKRPKPVGQPQPMGALLVGASPAGVANEVAAAAPAGVAPPLPGLALVDYSDSD